MKVLVLGGTRFLGRHFTAALLAGGHEVTLFNRGVTAPGLFPECERLVGNRETGELSALRGRRWDAAADCSAFCVPWIARGAAELLRDAVEHYTFVSSLSVYRPAPGPVHEGFPLRRLAGPLPPKPDPDTLGALAAGSEEAVEECFPGRALLARSGIMVGPHDPTWRFLRWVERVAEGGEVLAPGRPDRKVQLIDARDLAAWLVQAMEAGTTGAYNLVGPAGTLTFGAMLESMREASGSDARFTWVGDGFLRERGVRPWEDLPLWQPEDEPEAAGIFDASNERALAAGLRFRPLVETVRDTLAWRAAHPEEVQMRGIPQARARERELLDAWHRAR